MPSGSKKHLKRINAPKHWMLSKLDGIFAPKPTPAGHKQRESIPMLLLLRNRLKYALNGREVEMITMKRFVKVDGKVRTDKKYPVGFQDVVEIEKTNDRFRMLYDTKGRFVLHPISAEEAKFKLCKVVAKGTHKGNIGYVRTNDGRHIRFVDPLIGVNDTVKIDLETGKITSFVKFAVGNLCMVTSGANQGRVGQIVQREAHPGSFEIVHIRDANNNTFTTRLSNVFVLGNDNNSLVTLPRGRGIKLTTIQDRKRKIRNLQKQKKGKRLAKQS